MRLNNKTLRLALALGVGLCFSSCRFVSGTATENKAAAPSATANAGAATPTSAPSQLVWTAGREVLSATSCNPYTVTAQNSSSVALNVASNTTVTFTGTGNGKLYSDVCVTELSKNSSSNYITTIENGTNSKTVYFKNVVAEDLILNATASGLTDGTKIVYVYTSYLGDGADGPLSISDSQSLNSYASMSGNHVAGTTVITVDSTSGFEENGEVLIVQMEGPSAGTNNEFITVVSISGNTLTLEPGLENSYVSGTPNTAAPNAKTTQIVTVPHYTSVTVNGGGSITPGLAWNGLKGGIIAFRANGAITVNGSITATGYGFWGGLNITEDIGYQGNSILGKGTQSMSANSGGGGGGGGHSNVCGSSSAAGGAGGNYSGGATTGDGSCGPLNPCTAIAGSTYGVSSLSSIYFGSGGGGGGACSGGFAGNGGAGGGIILVFGKTLLVTGTILSNGANGTSADYSGGGGSGGAIVLVANESATLGSNLISANGGLGGSGILSGGVGGAGRITINTGSITGTTSPTAETGIYVGPLTALSYSSNPAIYGINQAITNNTPTANGDADPLSYSISPPLPTGLSLDTRSGVISGTPVALVQNTHIIIATTVDSSAQVSLPISVINAAEFGYTEVPQTFIVPSSITSIVVKAWGAGGSGGGNSAASGGVGGGAAYVGATLSVTPGEALTVDIGGGAGVGISGSGEGASGGGGGGASNIKRGSTLLLIAGGGGGGGGGGTTRCSAAVGAGGPGGGSTGGSGGAGANSSGGTGGSQSAGGMAGCGEVCGGAGAINNGGEGANHTTGTGSAANGAYNGGAAGGAISSPGYWCGGAGGGGGGYYGGGGGGTSSTDASVTASGGGGGSSYCATSCTMIPGSGSTPGNSTDSQRDGAGDGAVATEVGSHGRVIISW